MKEFKYKAIFNVEASLEKGSYKTFQTTASVKELEGLRPLLPSDQYMQDHDDLLFCSFNLAVAGMINKNNHGILPSTAEKMAKYWVNRPLNIEHDRKQTVGCIISTGFSSFGDNKIITVSEALKSGKPFNLCMGGVVWKVVDPWFADYLEYTNKYSEKDNPLYGKISTSWEVGFSEYVIARGSRNLFNAEIVTDKAEIERLSVYLTQFGGTGFDDTGVECYLVISGDARPLGGGFTENPAAAVKSVFIPDEVEEPDQSSELEDGIDPTEKEIETEDFPECECDPEMEMEDSASKSENLEKSSKNNQKNKNKISQKTKITVKKINDMKFKDINDFVDKYSEAVAKQEVFAASDVREFIQEAFLKDAEKWQSQVTEKENLIKAANDKVAELEASLVEAKESAKKTSNDLDSLKTELAEIRETAKKAEETASFNQRMSELDEKYNLDDKVRKKITKDIFGMSDEAFAEWKAEDGDVILSGREKKFSDSPEKALKEVKASDDFVPNAGADSEEKKEEKKLYKAVASKKNGGFEIELV